MLESKQDSPSHHPSKTFLGLRFLLLGFDPIEENKVRSKLVDGGGVDVGRYGQNCSHVIVDKLVYDDSVCVAARNDGKTLVTGLWVDHSYDIGMPADATSIMYRPLNDLNGIPGAKSLIMCLTGYQRQDRDDIMTMVGLMGANFSKPLVANKVTHLICYKFEGEKYELAKKVEKIKLVNHRWLEDCLKAWEILPEANYNKSGHELEMMEAEAKDSEEEAEDIATKQFGERKMTASPFNFQTGMPRAHELPILTGEVSKILQDTTAPKGLSNDVNSNDMILATEKETRFDQASNFHNVNKKHPEKLGCQDIGVLRDATCGELSKLYDKTPPIKVGNDSASTSRGLKRSPHSDAAKSSAISYSRKTPRRTTLPMHSGEISSSVSSSVKVNLGKFKVDGGFDISPSKVEQAKDGTDSGCVKTPWKGTKLLHEEGQSGLSPQKRKADVSCASTKSQKMSHDSKPCISGSPSGSDRIEGLEPTSLTNGPLEINKSLSFSINDHSVDETAILNSAQKSAANISTSKFISFNKKSLTCDLPMSKTVISEIREDGNAEEALQTSLGGLRKPNLASKPDVGDVGTSISENVVRETGEQHNQKQDVELPPSSTKKLEIKKSDSPANLDGLKGGNANSLSKPLRRKMVAKKSLGSRPKLSTSNTTNRKGSIDFNRTVSQNDAVICSIGGKETANHEKSVSPEKLEMVPPTVAVGMDTKDVPKSGNGIENKTAVTDDETEAPEDKDEHECEEAVGEEKFGVVDLAHKVDIVMEDNLECVQHITNKTSGNILGMHGDEMASGEGKNGTEFEKAVSGKKTELGESTSTVDAVKEKITKGKKQPSGKPKKKTVLTVTEIMESKKCVNGKGAKSEKNKEKTEMENKKRMPFLAGKTKSSTVIVSKSKNSVEVEKENKPIGTGDRNANQGKQGIRKVTSKYNKTPMKAGETDPDSMQMGGVPKVKTEPVWFILSGHQLQRKEFQQVIRRLKGKFCRDSHHWSYQATHFIVPDPIRRTEKFFAAAASGRWILRMDYLSASNQAGKFLAEEPYEWHKNGLSEDGAINLEAPRKWRLLRERTGHGAFYGMRIIIYGECIAPPLDALKRVVKAGEGTILATSPPYTRFLKSGVDFAIVSPGMPRVDLWVQEFLRHEIPCVVADYLVEYVCRPGYSLERHVQYNTHAWAEKSFANLLSRSEEIVEDLTPPNTHCSNDLTCQVCGSCDRGEVMLICGDESGSVGCGVGFHIDCCDPPLEDVPKEDWFCPKCSRSRNRTNPPKNTKKGTSLLKSK